MKLMLNTIMGWERNWLRLVLFSLLLKKLLKLDGNLAETVKLSFVPDEPRLSLRFEFGSCFEVLNFFMIPDVFP